MFGRHRTAPDQDLAVVAQSFHDGLARSAVTRRTDPPRIDPRNLRGRLAASPSIGLRARIDRRNHRRFDRRLSAT